MFKVILQRKFPALLRRRTDTCCRRKNARQVWRQCFSLLFHVRCQEMVV